ncbi:hypothetical protein [Methylomagnum ishizawai]|uniref:hypothetical protein n=1 Tax=Methylomagnum ishizawai TaxID=1760988 RepID=UPI001C335D4E|nr:hypothetical protein [Methylomagnum ishizawai]BBL75230.1 hypothetical protein MishRS11D_23280 [Methylomagnum ishizawai]
MSSLDSQAQVLLLRHIGELETALFNLGAAVIADGGRPAWVEGQDQTVLARQACAAFLQRLDYSDALEPGGTERLQGLLGASDETLRWVGTVNRLKQALHGLLMRLDSGVIEGPKGQPTQRAWTAQLLTGIGRARFNRRQAVRSFTILDARPVAASYFWGKVRKIVRITRDEARLLLEKRIAETGDIDPRHRSQFEALMDLPEDEPLAQVQQLKEYPRVNLTFPTPEGPVRKQVMAAAPLFYPAEIGAMAPEIIPLPDLEKKRRRLRRNDLSIELHAFLPSIRVHRYIKDAKHTGKD